MEEPLLAAFVANETEPPVTNESLDRAACHPSLLEHALCPGRKFKFRSTETAPQCTPEILDMQPAHPWNDLKRVAGVQN